MLTRRRYEPNKKRLYTEGVEQIELNLTANQYIELSRDDIQVYIGFILNNDPAYKEGWFEFLSQQQIADEEYYSFYHSSFRE